mmetsp:Transcript_22163/g.62021  ORF Transcript_22163/g.62021 Transcript_22163/m.62021 type:complete len:230 (+) Transcript_22163:485-1174(+)
MQNVARLHVAVQQSLAVQIGEAAGHLLCDMPEPSSRNADRLRASFHVSQAAKVHELQDHMHRGCQLRSKACVPLHEVRAPLGLDQALYLAEQLLPLRRAVDGDRLDGDHLPRFLEDALRDDATRAVAQLDVVQELDVVGAHLVLPVSTRDLSFRGDLHAIGRGVKGALVLVPSHGHGGLAIESVQFDLPLALPQVRDLSLALLSDEIQTPVHVSELLLQLLRQRRILSL